MIITLKMKIQDQEFTLNCNLTNSAGRIYRQQFSRDLLKDMSDICKKINRSPFEGINLKSVDVKGKTEQEIYQQILDQVDVSALLESQESKELDFEETERGYQIVWAFVKNADDKTPIFSEWSDGFDFVLPVRDIVPALYTAWQKSAMPIVEIKN